MKHEPPIEDDDILAGAFRSVRETYDGQNDEANLTLQRALFRTRGDVRKRKLARLSLLPIAAALVVSTAWAGMTGRLTVHVMLDLVHPENVHTVAGPPLVVAPTEPLAVPAPSSLPLAPALPEPAPVTEPEPEPRKAKPVATAFSAPPVAPPPPVASPPPHPPEPVAKAEPFSPPPAPSVPDPNAALFAEAHRLHFLEKDPAKALVAWDAYLKAAPDGHLAPEAHYNRALALVRLDRRTEAVSELVGFANGSWGGYRRAEAKALLDALVDAGH